MICGTFATAGLQPAEADQVEQDYRNTDPPPLSVFRTQAPDGTITVTAIFPPCPAETTHDPGDPGSSGQALADGTGGRPPVAPAGPAGPAASAFAAERAPAAGAPRGRYAIDSLDPVSTAILAAAQNVSGGGVPAFWGRYFYAPGQVNSSGRIDRGHYSAAENDLLRGNGIRVLPICRQTGNVGQGSAMGARDAARNLDALFEVFPPAYLSGADPDVLMFLDSERAATQPTLSADYYAGWSTTIVQRAALLSNGRVRAHPALYASRSDTGAWAALRRAVSGGAVCDGVWVAAWNTTPAMVDWSDARTTPAGGLPCPVLAWQYSDKGAGFDTDQTNPAHDDVLLGRLVMPPGAVA